MNPSNLKQKRKLEDIVDIGSCIKIKNSNKIFQIIGINSKKSICWIREWPLNYEHHQTFAIPIKNVKFSKVCPVIKDKESV